MRLLVYCSNNECSPVAGFTGKERDQESGLDYFRARFYGSALGRWTSPDWSAKPQPVPYAELTNPQTLNLYTYVQNNPLKGPDVDGHEDLYVMLDNGKVRNDITGQVSDLNKSGQMALGGIELGSAAISGGATLEAESIFSTLVGALTTSGLLASGVTRTVATAAGAEPEKVEGAASAAQTVTNPIGLATTVVKGNVAAGTVATDVSNAAAAASNPKDAARDPAGTALTVANVIQDVKAALSPVSLSAGPKAPPPPKMCGSNACP